MYDYDEIEKLAIEHKPKLIIAGYSAYSRLLDYKRFREIADKVGAILFADIAHIAGLVAARVIPSPVPYCDIVTSTSHKSLRSVRGAFILCKEKYAKAIDKAVFPSGSGGALQNMIAGKAIGFAEAMTPEFKQYAEQVLINAQVLCLELWRYGFNILTNGTENHMMLIDLRDMNISGAVFERELAKVGIATNKNSLPFDTTKPTVTSGLRIGTPAVTARGMKSEEMKEIADIIFLVGVGLKSKPEGEQYLDDWLVDELRKRVKKITKKYPLKLDY